MLGPAHVLLALTLGLTMPLFEVLARGADFFVARQATPGEVVAVALAWALGPWLVAAGLVRLGGHRVAFGISAAGFAAFLGCVLGNRAWPPALIVAVALLGGVAIAGALAREPRLRGPAGAAAGLGPLLVAHLLLATPVAKLLGGGEPRPAPPAGAPGPDVVVLLFDEFPLHSLEAGPGVVDGARLPAFARLAAGSTWYPRAAAAHPLTHPATAAIATGDLDAGLGAATWRALPGTLFSLLGGSHRLVVREPQTDLCPDAWVETPPARASLPVRVGRALRDLGVVYLHVLLPRPWRRALPPVGDGWRGFAFAPRHRGWDVHPARGHLEDFAARLAAARPGGPAGPALYYLHVTLPHHPWVFHPSGVAVDEGSLRGLLGRSSEWWRMAEQYRAYQLQLGWVDQRLGEVLDALETSGLWDSALVVVTADHGMAFRPAREVRNLDRRNLGEILPVPLFVRYPGQTDGVVDARRARTVDVLPTLAAALGRRVPWPVDGRDLRGPPPVSDALRTAEGDFSWSDLAARRAQDRVALAAMVRGDPARPDGIHVGPFGSLAGTPVDAWPPGEAGSLVVGLAEGAGPRLPGPGPWAPLRVRGEVADLRGESPASVDLALVAGGVVQAVTGTFQDGRGQRFSTVLPATALPALREGLEVHHIGGTPAAPTLARLPVRRDVTHVLVDDGDEWRLLRPGRAPVVVHASGHAVRLVPGPEGTRATGEAPRECDALALFVEGELVALRPVSPGPFSVVFPRPRGAARVLALGPNRAWDLGP